MKVLHTMASAKSILASDVGVEPQLRHRLGSRARVVAADRTWDQMVARYLPLYAAAR